MGSNANSGTLDTTRLTIMSLSDQPPAQVDYWAQLDEQLLTKRMEHDRLRDHALVAICIACLILTVPLAWWTFRNGLRQKPSPQQ
ncbi:MAG: hypothetical protein JKX85_03255 [Phycisphaeraceae bacterium]|nr:hypothetical protein [Phycisphaeraceae bacterium]